MITVRDARISDVPDIARIHIDMWRLAYAEILHAQFLRQLQYSRSRIQWQSMIERRSGVLLVAELDGEGVVGFAAGGAERTRALGVDGELMALYVLQRLQRAGVGRALVHHMALRFAENGRNGMIVWVLKANPARGFYRRLGGRRAETQKVTLGDRQYAEVSYVWKDLESLIEATTDRRPG